MSDPISVDLPHTLGTVEAKRRVERGFGKLGDHIPGGRVTRHRWDGDTLYFTVSAMGQTVDTRLDVMADKVHAEIDLPPMLALFAGPIRAMLAKEGPRLLT